MAGGGGLPEAALSNAVGSRAECTGVRSRRRSCTFLWAEFGWRSWQMYLLLVAGLSTFVPSVDA